uniref:CCHC-type domain-containing protein n=1 Tax=Globodera rostochiensis TaxID=31243 RepID=A0A914H5R1_GLORO
MQQLTQVLQQMLTNQQQNVPPIASVQPLPSLPNVECFEPAEDRSIADWLERFNFALDCAAPQLADDKKVKLLMTKLSEAAFGQYSKSCLPKKVTEFTFAKTEEHLKAAFGRPQSIWIDRYECLRASRNEDENFRAFINRHKRLLRDFEFRKLNEEQFLCLMLLTALKAPKEAELRKRILSKLAADGDRVKYDGVVEDLQMYQSTIAEAKVIEQPSSSKNLFAVKRKPFPMQKGSATLSPTQRVCWRCGKTSHPPIECPHSKTVCRKCNKVGHVEAQCARHQEWLNRNKGSKNTGKRACTLRMGGVLVNVVNQPTKLIEVPVSVNGSAVNFLLDSGAEVTVLNEETHCLIGAPRLSRCNEQAKYHDGTSCRLLGRGEATFKFGGIAKMGQFYVSKKGSLNLLGIEMLDAFGLLDDARKKVATALQLNTIKSDASDEKSLTGLKAKFPDVFCTGLGHCTKAKATLTLKADATPVYCRPRPAPYNTKLVVDAELDRLQAMNVIRPVEHSR